MEKILAHCSAVLVQEWAAPFLWASGKGGASRQGCVAQKITSQAKEQREKGRDWVPQSMPWLPKDLPKTTWLCPSGRQAFNTWIFGGNSSKP
jgi:hypothetical protein